MTKEGKYKQLFQDFDQLKVMIIGVEQISKHRKD